MSFIKSLRTTLISRHLYRMMQHSLPAISQTEQEALTAGNTWWDAELFSGQPDWKKLDQLPAARLTETEQAFIDGPVETLCGMLDDWDITYHRHDLPPEVWDFIKQQRFCGIIIPQQYGGLAFSEFAHSQIVMKIASRSTTAAVTVMVPNSLGPAKLLLAYGTEQQKNHYLPRLARGQDMPAFALTGPKAGSDASAIPDSGVVCYGSYQGEDHVLGMRLNWEKRYITLGPVATVLGMAFRLYDPDHLLGEEENPGITLALIPTDTEGVSIGQRHLPMESAFQNGPNWGKDVFVPIDFIIGGRERAGQGWRMLMQCLATGRAISLPALSVGSSKFVCRTTGAYARIREQFNLPLGYMEGIEDVLARMAGETYVLDAARQVTCAALDNGEKPAIISAILKYKTTEGMRRVINDAMDIQGGSGICLGPMNYIGRLYQVIPIGITVEGANILTRSLMIFGQGSVRCHPFVLKELEALQMQDKQQGLSLFDDLIWQHIAFFVRNLLRGWCYSITGTHVPADRGNNMTRPYYKKLQRLTTAFAVMADFTLMRLGGGLKRKERLSGQFADVLSNLYLCSCALKHFKNQGCQQEDEPLLHWACQTRLFLTQEALFKAATLTKSIAARSLLFLLFPLGRIVNPVDDGLTPELAKILITKNPARQRLTEDIYIDKKPESASGRVEQAFNGILQAASAERKLRQFKKQNKLEEKSIEQIIDEAVKNNILMPEEIELINQASQARASTIGVDSFEKL